MWSTKLKANRFCSATTNDRLYIRQLTSMAWPNKNCRWCSERLGMLVVPVGKPMALSLSSALGSTISYVVESYTSLGPLSLKAYKHAKLTNIGNALCGSPLRLTTAKGALWGSKISLTYTLGYLIRPTTDWNNSARTRLVHHNWGRRARESTTAASINIGMPRILWIMCILSKVLDCELLTTDTFSTM